MMRFEDPERSRRRPRTRPQGEVPRPAPETDPVGDPSRAGDDRQWADFGPPTAVDRPIRDGGGGRPRRASGPHGGMDAEQQAGTQERSPEARGSGEPAGSGRRRGTGRGRGGEPPRQGNGKPRRTAARRGDAGDAYFDEPAKGWFPRGRVLTWLVVATVTGLVAAIAVAVLTYIDPNADEVGDGTPEATGAAPSSYSEAPSTEVFKRIDSRSADKRPLSVREVFNAATRRLDDKDAKVVLKLRTSKLDANCGLAVWSRSLAAELRKAGCSQVLRGLYSDDKQRFGAIVAIFNLAEVEQANAIVRRLSPDVGSGFVLPPPAEPPLNRFGQGFSIARGRAMGHYVLLSWVQRLDGSGDERDEQLHSLVVTGGQVDEAILRRAVSSR